MTDTNPRDLIERLAYELDAETGYTNHRTGEQISTLSGYLEATKSALQLIAAA